MAGFIPGGNSALDKALDIISPHSGEKLGSIGIEEFEKFLAS